ncbi:anti-sigma factor domain-containing protein [Nonomuraea sp. NPDC050556]|uniref:anti-sigma factor n=1 Tax=Nonomuraea sp. NPDC050556 TaxID=3364369 RepID=UPI0037B4AFD0
MNEDLHTLSGAYALHALPRREGALFEEHLAGCPACEDEVRGLRETAARLAVAVAESPPPELRPRVLAAIQQVRQAPAPAERRDNVVPLRPRRTRIAMALTAVAAAAAVALGVLSFNGQQQLDRLQARQQEIVAVLAAPDARTVRQPVTAGGTATVLVSRARGKMVVATAGLPALPGGKVYELWLMGKGGVRPAGLLDGEAPVLADTLRGDDHVGLTVEPAGGSKQPTTQPIMFAELPA